MPADLLSARGIALSYPRERSPAIFDVDINVSEGDLISIVGPSGSGKTTLLKLLAGALSPTGGTISRLPGLRVGYVPQVDKIDWYFPATVTEVVLMAAEQGRLLPWASRSARRRSHEVFERLGIGSLASRPIRALSGGEQQRVFIARALIGGPSLLLLDEPISGVDVATRHEVLHLIHDLNHAEGMAVVLTTHDLNGIAAHTHEIVCLNRTVIAAGVSSDILNAEVLERTYGAPLEVLTHGGMPIVVDRYDPAAVPEHHEHHEH